MSTVRQIKFAAECQPCPDGCGEPWCPDCNDHYADCKCPGPHSEMEPEVEPVKRCNSCGATKPLSAFYRTRTVKDGRRGSCKVCETPPPHPRVKLSPETLAANRTAYIQTPERKKKHRETEHLRRWIRAGVFTEEKYLAVMAKSNGLCQICGRPETKKRGQTLRRLAIDHDHKTNKFRGLLCADCNIMIGMAGEDPDRLKAAAAYLLAHGSK